jgi:hypothetical protein
LTKPVANRKRNQTADLLKGLAVIFMIQVHIMEQFAKPDIYHHVIGKISLFIGGPPCAPVFMAVMGYFLASSERPFAYFLKRGLILFAGGILLNIARSANLLHYMFTGESTADPFFYIFGVDIFLLAGLSIIIIGLLQFLFKKNFIFYFILAIAISAVVPLLPPFATGTGILSYLNAFLWGNFGWSYFPLFPWMAYILAGYSLSLFESKYQVLSKCSTGLCLVISIPLIIATGFTLSYASGIAHDLSSASGYYHHQIIFFAWLLMFISAYAMIVHLIEKNAGKLPATRYVKWVGKNVTIFYVIQWIIIGNIATEIYQTQNTSALILWFAGITMAVSTIVLLWNNIILKSKNLTNK